MDYIRRSYLWKIVPIVMFICFILLAPISGLFPFTKKVRPQAPLDEYTSHLDKRIPTLMNFYDIPGSSIALVKGGELVWSKAYGYADLESGRKLTTDTPMRVQSISKSITAWGIMKLVEQGRIELDAPIIKYFKNWNFPDSKISTEQVTVRQLLSHTGGLPLGDVFTIYSPYEKMPSLKEKLTIEAVLIREPGSAFSYSNTGYNLLELLIEEVTGQAFNEYMRQEILLPLGMKHSTFIWNEGLEDAVSVGYDLKGKPVPAYVYPEKASGGLFSTAEDIATFTMAGMKDSPYDKQILNPNTIETMYMPAFKDIGIYNLVFHAYGLGHYLETLPNGYRAISHGGQGSGIMTHYHSIPESGDAIVILTNSQRSWPFISHLLRDWAQWLGVDTIGMERIIWGKYGLWAVIALIWSTIIYQSHKIIIWCIKRKRNELPNVKRSKLLTIVKILVALLIIIVLVWCKNQRYLFLSSVFPIASQWLSVSGF
ncbi:MAG: beta-lactamase family protein, partial [Clostridiales bacterium]|nr:beta-lactamase family protein [Clostridiales bacterium]